MTLKMIDNDNKTILFDHYIQIEITIYKSLIYQNMNW